MTKHSFDAMLNDLLRHVAYEYAALTVSYEEFQATGEANVWLIECFLIHARNGYVFVYKRRGERDTHSGDCFAEDYLAGWDATATSELASAYSRMHIQVAHLSADRAKETNAWHWSTWRKRLPKVFHELDTCWRRFQGALVGARAQLFADGLLSELARLRGDDSKSTD